MKLYNTLTKKIDEIQPLTAGKVQMFVCGPTVYDYSHLGHAKTYTQLDVLARTVRASGFDAYYLQNITDIDDKIIARATENNISWQELRDTFEAEYHADMTSLNNTSVTSYARATDYIDDIIEQVKTLIQKGHAYQISDGIYFEIATFPAYGKLSGRTEVQENDAQTRIDASSEKRGWNDFCLWKFSKLGEPTWDAPFGAGRPGWHIEDTAITEHFFGPQYDIHGGAIDLIFPHHEAEITQMESASERIPFVKYWIHTGFLNIDDTKMSKSLKNFYTIREVIDKGYDPIAIRLLMLQSHYRSSVNFNWDNLDAASNRLQAYRAMADLRWQPITNSSTIGFAESYKSILEALATDLNTPQALAHLSALEEQVNSTGISVADQPAFATYLKDIDDLLGLKLCDSADISDAEKLLIGSREAARQRQDWATSDAIRDELAEQGIGLRDTTEKTIWYRL